MTTPLAPHFLKDSIALDHMTDPIFIKDHLHRWVYVNEAMCQLLQRPKAQVLGKSDADFMPVEVYQGYWVEDDAVLETGAESHKEEDIHEGDTPIRRILTKKSRIDVEGTKYVFGVIRDITDLARAGRLTQLGEIAASLSHELMTPLTIMDLQLQNFTDKLASKSASTEDVANLVRNMEKSKDRLLGIIKSVRAFAQNHCDLPMCSVKVQSIIDEAVELANPRIKERQVKLILEATPQIQVMCRGPQLGQILVNLLHNAADAVAGTPDPWVKVHFRAHNEWLDILVTDSGPGIPPEIAAKLMTPFFTTKPSHSGTGLGLSLAAKIALEHGGDLRYDDKQRNTCFRLRLPLVA